MSVSLRARARIALREGELVFAQEIRSGLRTLGETLASRVRAKMREDTGEEKKNVRASIKGASFRLTLIVSGDKPQTLVDEYGRKAGAKLPPYKRGSNLYKWAERKGMFAGTGRAPLLASQARALGQIQGRGAAAGFNERNIKRNESTAFLIARKIARDGIPARKPFERTAKESERLIQQKIDESIARGARRLQESR